MTISPNPQIGPIGFSDVTERSHHKPLSVLQTVESSRPFPILSGLSPGHRSTALGAGSRRFESCRPDQTTFFSGVWRTHRTRKEQTRCYPAKNAGDRCSMLLCAVEPAGKLFPPRGTSSETPTQRRRGWRQRLEQLRVSTCLLRFLDVELIGQATFAPPRFASEGIHCAMGTSLELMEK
jgi:hypothetical protein